MAYFHIDRAIRYLESLGFRGERTIFRKPIAVDANGTQEDDENDPPCVRRVDERLTFEVFDHDEDADEHVNGQIWSAALLEIFTALDRNIADRIILESHFQLDGFTTFARAARAIIDADRNLYGGRHIAQLRVIFRRKGIGPVE
jgi:hypothetical protein